MRIKHNYCFSAQRGRALIANNDFIASICFKNDGSSRKYVPGETVMFPVRWGRYVITRRKSSVKATKLIISRPFIINEETFSVIEIMLCLRSFSLNS